MEGEVVVDCFPEAVDRYREGWTLVAVDVIRATTTAVTACWKGFRVFPAQSLDDASCLAGQLEDPLLVGELGGIVPAGFHESNSPVAIERRTDTSRPVVLLSTSGTRLLRPCPERDATYAACLRNASAQAEWLVDRHPRVALVGAGARGQFREEDQYGCARIALRLLEAGYRPGGMTAEVVDRWSGLPPAAFLKSRSVGYLRRTGQTADLDFVLDHDDDIPAVFPMLGTEIGCIAVAVPEANDDIEVVG
ncbi:MAG TPA: 2-phosphosulfolactate phosphatase [Nocardioidaceae bacterium]|nr:2-phosphosulfolactate phosphatase [Nocardioidaceae bacterium]